MYEYFVTWPFPAIWNKEKEDDETSKIVAMKKRMDEEAKMLEKVVELYNLNAWCNMNYTLPSQISISEWIGTDWWQNRYGLHDVMQAAITSTFKKIQDSQALMAKSKQRMNQGATPVQFPVPTVSSLHRYH